MEATLGPLDSELLTAALSYARSGWPVIPLHTPVPGNTESAALRCSCRRECQDLGKHPRTAKGLLDATTDESKIREWWDKWPNANVGVRTGPIGVDRFLVVLDVDAHKHGLETLQDLEAQNGKLPDTPVSLTGSGGRHILFVADRPVKNSVEKVGPGLDVRGLGGYIVAPPSLHGSGKRYEWELSSTPDLPLAPMPSWLLSRVAQERPGRIASVEAMPSTVSEGGRNEALFKLACSLRAKGLSADAILQALIVENNRICVPPLDEVEVQKIVGSASKYRPGRSQEYEERVRARLRVVDGGASAKDDESPRETEPFDRGDAVELAQCLLVDLQGDGFEPIVYDRNEFWRYDEDAGVYRSVLPSEAYVLVSRYAGHSYMTKDGPKPLKLSDAAITGAVKAASNLAARPEFFNSAPTGIAFKNGFVTVEKGKVTILPHSPDHRAIHALPFEYDARARAPRWEEYLQEIFAGASEEDRAGRIGLLQEHAGACLLGSATTHATSLVLTGDGANGKSVYLQVVRSLFPSNAVASIAPQLWENRFYLAELAGVRLNAVAELPEREIADSESFKAVISGDAVMVARKHQRPFTLRPIAGHVFACNSLPGTRDQSDGYWRRFVVIPFDRVFSENERELNLAERLVRSELPGIAAWVLEGAARLDARGRFDPPESSVQAKAEWQRESDQVRQFLDECTSHAPGHRSSPSRAYESFLFWAKRTGHQGMTRRKFWVRLSKLVQQRKDDGERFYELWIRPEWAPPNDRY